MPQLLATTCQKCGSFDDTVWNFNTGPILQLFCNCVVCSQSTPQHRKITKNDYACKFMFESPILKTSQWKSFFFFLIIDKQCGN